ncbi:MAG: NUDIX hydrolase [Desulfovibrionaceae bacterium]
MEKSTPCPHCGGAIVSYANPSPTVDVIIYHPPRGVVLIERKNPPYGYALPGGFVDEGECAEAGAVREMHEETSLTVKLTGLLGVYSDPARDPRHHNLGLVFVGSTAHPEALCAGDDAASAAFCPLDALPDRMAFDHRQILEHFLEYLDGKRQLASIQYGY